MKAEFISKDKNVVKFNMEISAEEFEAGIVKAFQKAQTKAQEIAAEKTKDILGFDPSNLAGLLGGGNGAGMPEIPGLS